MKHVTTTFLRGLFTLLPLLLSIYVLLWFLSLVEGFAREFLLRFLPQFLYIPGMGTVLVMVLIYAFGVVVDRPLARWIFSMVEGVFREVPIVKTVYLAIKDFTEYFKPGSKRSNQVVLVRFPNTDIELIGLLTRESLDDLDPAVTKTDRVAVYFPMGYQIGGYTLFIPRAWVRPTEMSVEAAMRAVITAFLPGEQNSRGRL